MIFGLLILILLLGISLVRKKIGNGNPKQSLPPGPWGLPLLGHLPSLGLNPHLTLMKWKKKYGPIISCRFGSFPTVVLCDPKLVKEAYNMNEFSGRPHLTLLAQNKIEKGIIFSEGSHNSELRNFTVRKFKEFGVGRKQLETQIHIGVSEFLDFVKMRKGLPVNSEGVPCAHIIRTLWSILMTTELDTRAVEQMHHSINQSMKMGSTLSELANFMPWMEKIARILSLGHFSLVAAKSKQLQLVLSFMAKFLEEKKITCGKGQGQLNSDIMNMFLGKMAVTTDKSSPFHESHGAATHFLADVFVGGMHTVHTSLVWMLCYMARNPEVQLKLQEEIDQVVGFGSGKDFSRSRLPSLLDKDQMPYADAVVNEILRMSSIAPLAMPHKTMTDVRFHGYTIKKNTMVFSSTYGIHHDPEVWGDPEVFRPERWFGDSGRKLKSEHFLPFGTGRRICPGDVWAREQLFLYVTTLFQKYSVEFHLGKVPEVKGVCGVSLNPSKFTVVFGQRKFQ